MTLQKDSSHLLWSSRNAASSGFIRIAPSSGVFSNNWLYKSRFSVHSLITGSNLLPNLMASLRIPRFFAVTQPSLLLVSFRSLGPCTGRYIENSLRPSLAQSIISFNKRSSLSRSSRCLSLLMTVKVAHARNKVATTIAAVDVAATVSLMYG